MAINIFLILQKIGEEQTKNANKTWVYINITI